jgi:phosphoglycerate dehydrogenase-like enzyme
MSWDQNIKYNSIYICHDYTKNLKLYNLTNIYKKILIRKFPNIKFVEFNLKNRILLKKCLIYWGNLFDTKKLKYLPNLKWVHFGSTGVDRILGKEKILLNIKITNSKGIVNHEMTNLIFAFIFNILKGLKFSADLANKKMLNRKSYDNIFENVKNIENCKFIIFGYGQISKYLINKLSIFTKEIYVVSNQKNLRNNSVKKFYPFKNFNFKKFDYDFCINLMPLNKLTYQYFDKKKFNKMPKKINFINVSRGLVVNENDLYKALKNKKINYAALDVFQSEPLKSSNRLYKLKNILLTPHIGALSNDYWNKEVELFKTNLEKFLKKKKLINLV